MVKVALLIGVSEYEPGLNPLPASVKDIEALQRVLKDSEMGGFDEVKALPNPDRQTMESEIETLFSGRDKEDLVLLFFSGHGIKDDGNKLYFATRITRKNLKGELIRSTAVPANFVQEIMNNSRARRQTIILDCCFSGAFDPALQAKDDGSVDLQSLGAEGRVVLTSSSSTQYSFEQQGSDLSIYTRYLVEGIETGAGDRNEDGFVSVLELHEYAVSKVQETAPNMTPKIIVLKDKGFEIVLSKARVTDPKLRYRKAASRYANAGTIRPAGRAVLNTLRQQLDLTQEEATEIETEVLRPYQERLKNLQNYRETLIAESEHEYPISEEAYKEMNMLQKLLGLRDADILPIKQEVEAQFAQKSELYQQSLAQYKQALTEEIQREFPLNQQARQNLENLQKSLGLRNEEITGIEQPFFQQAEIRYQEKLRQEAAQQKQKQEKIEYNDKLRRYEQEFLRSIKAAYPLNQHILDGLKNFQQQLKLKDEDVILIEQPIRELAEEKAEQQRREKEKLDHENKLQRYEQELSTAIQVEYPLSEYVCQNLRNFQKFLGLSQDDINRIEKLIIEPKEAKYQKQQEEKRKQELALTLDLALSQDEMRFGTQKLITLEDGSVTVKIPAGISLGKRVRIQGKGKLDLSKKYRGDLYLRIIASPFVQENFKEKQSVVTIRVSDTGTSSILGIHLGISHLSASIVRDGYAIVLPNQEGSLKTPTTIACKIDGSWITGQNAKNQALINPYNTYDGIVRLLGRKYSEIVKENLKFSYKVIEDKRGGIKIECPALRKQLTPEEILAKGLRKLVDDANNSLTQKINQVVISVPSCFTIPQRLAVEQAAHLAGLECMRLISSSTLAAISYGYDFKGNATILVSDVDDGCIVTSILEIGNGVFETLSISGHCDLNSFKSNQEISDIYRICLENALRDARVSKNDIDAIVFVGETPQIQIVEPFLRETFNKLPIHNLFCGMAISLGASIQAGILSGTVTGILPLDATPWSIGIETLGGVMTKHIPRNTTFPTKKSEVYSTVYDEQTTMEIHVIEGEREFAKDNTSLGTFRIDGISPAPRGKPQIEITFDIYANHKLNIEAVEKKNTERRELAISFLGNFKPVVEPQITVVNK